LLGQLKLQARLGRQHKTLAGVGDTLNSRTAYAV